MGTPASLSSPLPSASLEHIPQRAASSASLATWVLFWVSDTITPLPSSLEKPRMFTLISLPHHQELVRGQLLSCSLKARC